MQNPGSSPGISSYGGSIPCHRSLQKHLTLRVMSSSVYRSGVIV